MSEHLPVDPSAAERLTRELREVLGRVLIEPAGEIGLLIQDRIALWRFRNLVRIARRAAAIAEENGLDPQPIRRRFLASFFEEASLEEDESLQDRWANLLVAAQQGNERVSYPRILAELEPIEAQILERLRRGAKLADLRTDMNANAWARKLGVTEHDLVLSFAILRREGLVRVGNVKLDDADARDPPTLTDALQLSPLGHDFWHACQGRPVAYTFTPADPI